MKKTVLVVGGGPGGYVAAIRAAQLGATVHLVEKEKVGGTCLNVGCIPTKALLHSAELFENISAAKGAGIEVGDITVNWPKVMQGKDRVVRRLVGGVNGLLKANGVTVHSGTAVVTAVGRVLINGEEELTGDAIVLATGSVPAVIPFSGHDLEGVLDSTGALSLKELPKSMVIMGGGVIGMEFAGLFSSFGCKVRVVELLPEILPMIDGDIVKELKKEMQGKGVEFYTNAKLMHVSKSENGLIAHVEQDGNSLDLEGDYVLVAVGRRPATKELGLEALGIAMERGAIVVDERFSTNVDGVYAIGDCNGKIMLAHAASAQGIAAVEHALGHTAAYLAETIPSCIYTHPEIASVGLSEAEAVGQGLAVEVGKFPLAGNGKTLIENGGKGLIKMITHAESGKVLGVHMIGPRATDLIAEAALAIRMGATAEDIFTTIHAHPTVGEAMAEAALATKGMAIHWPPESKA